MTNRPTTPCETCGKPTTYLGTKRCDWCWNIEHLLPNYLKSPGGQKFARKHTPLLDDWVDGRPDAWDYEAVLRDHKVTVEWGNQLMDGEGTVTPCPPDLCGWGFYWKHGATHIGQTPEIIARKAAALFVSLWLRGVSASFADKLMDGYVSHLELQDNTRLTFLAEIDYDTKSYGKPFFRLTRANFCTHETLGYLLEPRIIVALGVPNPDEEIIVTFAKRKKSP